MREEGKKAKKEYVITVAIVGNWAQILWETYGINKVGCFSFGSVIG